MFSCEFWKICKNIFSTEHLWTAAEVFSTEQSTQTKKISAYNTKQLRYNTLEAPTGGVL